MMQQIHSKMTRFFYGIVNPDGFLAGRKKLFVIKDTKIIFWKSVLKYAAVLFVPLSLFTFLQKNYLKNEPVEN